MKSNRRSCCENQSDSSAQELQLSEQFNQDGRVKSYQLNASKATNSQCVDDVEVSQLETGEKGVLSFMPEKRTDGNLFT